WMPPPVPSQPVDQLPDLGDPDVSHRTAPCLMRAGSRPGRSPSSATSASGSPVPPPLRRCSAASLGPGRPDPSERANDNSRSTAQSGGQAGRVDVHGEGTVGDKGPDAFAP